MESSTLILKLLFILKIDRGSNIAYLAEYTGVAAIIGAYIAGVISVTKFKHEVFKKVDTIRVIQSLFQFFLRLLGLLLSFLAL